MFEWFRRWRQLRRLEKMIRGTFLNEVLMRLLKIVESEDFYQSSDKVFPDEIIVGTLSEAEKAVYTLHIKSLHASKALIRYREGDPSLIPEKWTGALESEIALEQAKANFFYDLFCFMTQRRLSLDPMARIAAREDFQLVLGFFEEENVPEDATIQ